jgi:hypothetical protein
LNRAILTKLLLLAGQLHYEIATWDLAKVREKRLKDLDKAARDLNKMASNVQTLEERIKIFQVMGYLCQIIDGLLLNNSGKILSSRMKGFFDHDLNMDIMRKTHGKGKSNVWKSEATSAHSRAIRDLRCPVRNGVLSYRVHALSLGSRPV